MTLRKRFDYATELRAFAREAGKTNRDLATRMRTRADEVMRQDDPTEHGTRFDAGTVFASFGTKPARPAQAERRNHKRIAGTLTLAKAA